MPLNFNSIVALALGFFVTLLALLYTIVLTPLTYFLPQSLKFRTREYMVRLVEMGSHTLFRRSFSVHLAGDEIQQENALILLNHQGILDYLLLFYLGKRVQLFFYIYGYCVRFPSVRALYKSWYDKSNWVVSPRNLPHVFKEFDRAQGPKWVVMFPEVRAWTPGRARDNQLYCRLAGAPVLKKLLYPRFPGVVQGIDYLRPLVTSVYDFRVQYRPNAPSVNALISADKWKVSVFIKQTRISKVPRGPKQLEKYLEKLWYRKDRDLQREAGTR